jgi:hypothetical protein
VIDLRITSQAWRRLREDWAADPAVTSSSRRDWIELTISEPSDIARLAPLVTAAIDANR